MGPGGEGWGPALILRWNNQVAQLRLPGLPKVRRSTVNGEMVGGSADRRPPTRLEPAAVGRRWASRGGKKKVGGRRTDELKGVRASTLKGCCARLFQGPQDRL